MDSRALSAEPDVVAPDGSFVRLLVEGARGSMAHFELPAGHVARAVRHRSVEELWFVTAGRGVMWQEGADEPLDLVPGVSLRIAPRTAFQFRSTGPGPLTVVGVTMPPWPGEDEAAVVEGCWDAYLG